MLIGKGDQIYENIYLMKRNLHSIYNNILLSFFMNIEKAKEKYTKAHIEILGYPYIQMLYSQKMRNEISLDFHLKLNGFEKKCI